MCLQVLVLKKPGFSQGKEEKYSPHWEVYKMVTMRHYAGSAAFDHVATQSYPDVMHMSLCVCGWLYKAAIWPGMVMELHMCSYIL